MIGSATIMVTVIRIDVCVCVLAAIASAQPAVALMIDFSDCDDCKYRYKINCNVLYFSCVIRSNVSWKEFQCPTAEKIAIVAKIGLHMGSMIL